MAKEIDWRPKAGGFFFSSRVSYVSLSPPPRPHICTHWDQKARTDETLSERETMWILLIARVRFAVRMFVGLEAGMPSRATTPVPMIRRPS